MITRKRQIVIALIIIFVISGTVYYKTAEVGNSGTTAESYRKFGFERLSAPEAMFLYEGFSTLLIDCRRQGMPFKMKNMINIPDHISSSFFQIIKTYRNVVLFGNPQDEKAIVSIAEDMRNSGIAFPKILLCEVNELEKINHP